MENIISQISLFAENKPGKLATVARVLGEANVNIRALTIAEAGDFGVIRMVVDDTQKAYEVLSRNGFTVSITGVIGAEVRDVPGELYRIAGILGDNGVNIDYAYSFLTPHERAVLILRVDDVERAIELLKNNGVRLITEEDVKKI
ncbi:MAG: ACT domain-containing protein [Archaeoglobi archaeon]|nr:ACT domain-containing protein [Candidatus Mnemosynella bozhongmuii]